MKINMKESQLRQLLEEQVETFINNIAIELEHSHDQWFESFGFPMFGETSKEYHEQVYFQSYLESYTRKMINSIIKEICYEDCSDKITWPEFEYEGIYNGYTNSEYEKEYGFEFINQDQKIGYRYTFFQFDETEQLLTKCGIKSIRLVLWQNEDDRSGFHYADSRIKVILLWDLFQELFCEFEGGEIRVVYDLFVDYVSKAVERANSMISLVTLPGFTPSYIFKTREKAISNLQDEVRKLSFFYVKNGNHKINETNSKQLIEHYKLSEYFLTMKMEQSLVGFSDFAKSYLTSEYLYRYFKGNTLFDFTPVVSGYIKSIEQILHIICTRYRNSQHERINMGSYTLGNYMEYLESHNGIFRDELLPAKDIILKCLDSYRAESRNHLFHKNHLNSWERVKQIRTNTIFLYVTLLGSVEITLIKKGRDILGSINVEYDHLFSILDEETHREFIFVLNGTEYSGMQKQNRYQGLIFDRNGLIANTVRFKKFDYDHYEEVELSRSNMPSAIWIAESFGEKGRKIWSAS